MTDIGGESYTLTPLPDNVKVGRYSSIAEGCVFITGGKHLAEVNHKCVFTTNFDQTNDDLTTIIGNDVWVGRNVIFLQGVKIGNGAIIGAGAVISKDVPEYAVVVGSPQEIKRIRFTAEQIAKLDKIKWWEWSREKVFENLELMKDIDKFLEAYE